MDKVFVRKQLRSLSTTNQGSDSQMNPSDSQNLSSLADFLAQRKITDLASYRALGDEINLDRLHQHYLKDSGIRFWYPRVEGSEIQLYHRDSLEEGWKRSQWKILEPDPAFPGALDWETLEAGGPVAVLVPGQAFSLHGHRLGRGGGFYDRFLQKHPGLIKIGITSKNRILEQIPTDPWDQKMDWLFVLGQGMVKCVDRQGDLA